MSVLIADMGRGLFLGCERTGRLAPVPCPAQCPFLALCHRGELLVASDRQREVYRLTRGGLAQARSFPAPPGMVAMLLSPCGRQLYQLGGECDSVHMRGMEKGELIRVCPAGVYPRDMRLDSTGRYLLIAGGASGELILMDARELRALCSIELGGAVCAADFTPGGAMALVTRENGDLETCLCRVPASFDRFERLALFEGQAGALLALPDGSVAIGLQDGVKRYDAKRHALTTLSAQYPLPACMEYRSGALLVSDTLTGQVARLSLSPPFPSELYYQGGQTRAVYV